MKGRNAVVSGGLCGGLFGGLWLALLVLPLAAEDPTCAVRKQLEQRLEVTYSEQPLEDVLMYMAAKLELQMHVQWRKLEDTGIARDSAVSLQLKDVKGSVALELLLDQVGDGAVGYYLRDNLLVITSIEDAASSWQPRVFFVTDLVDMNTQAPSGMPGMGMPGMPGMAMGMGSAGGDSSGMSPGSMMPGASLPGIPDSKQPREQLLDFITAAVAPGSWDEVGGNGTIEYYRGFLVVKNSQRVQAEVAALLEAMRTARQPQPATHQPRNENEVLGAGPTLPGLPDPRGAFGPVEESSPPPGDENR